MPIKRAAEAENKTTEVVKEVMHPEFKKSLTRESSTKNNQIAPSVIYGSKSWRSKRDFY
jgi:hypothetical protein